MSRLPNHDDSDRDSSADEGRASGTDTIRIIGARQNNLQDVTVAIPKGKLTAVTGVSGSGKSSLAFDTLYAEGQRRYVESFSTYARQFLERMDRPDVDRIDGLLPAVALEQKNSIRSSRSTLGSLTEVADYLKLLYTKLGVMHCDVCNKPVIPDHPGTVAAQLLDESGGARIVVTFRFRAGAGDDAAVSALYLKREGYDRIFSGGKTQRLGDEVPEGSLDVVVDRLKIAAAERERLVEAIELAYRMGQGDATLHLEGRDGAFVSRQITEAQRCCGNEYPSPTEGLFSFNSPIGACDTCRGFGRVMGIDMDRVVPDQRLPVEKAIQPWLMPRMSKERAALRKALDVLGIDRSMPFNELNDRDRAALLDGGGGPKLGEFLGVRPWFKWLERKSYKMHVRIFIARYRSYLECPDCGGSRFKPETLRYKLGGRAIPEVLALPVTEARTWLVETPRGPAAEALAPVIDQLDSRLRYMVEVGIGYLSLARQARTLSGGEVQRANLTTALGSGLVNTLFVLDEPTIGLHPADSERLANQLAALTTRDNTVVVVEHDPDMLRVADHVVEMGPGPGTAGGTVVYQGPASGLHEVEESATAKALAARSAPRTPANKDTSKRPGITIRGARAQNLKGVDAHLPAGHLTVVTGVSGSGKSTLLEQVLYRNFLRARGKVTDPPGDCDGIDRLGSVWDVVWVDQSPPQASSRANPATYVKAWDGVRKLFAKQDLSKERGYTPTTFSFNTGTGRCAACEGAGVEKVEMQFLADVLLTCEVCNGKRFKEEVLDVTWRDYTVADMLGLTVNEAIELLGMKSAAGKRLLALQEVGCGYLKLGQPLATLSGGESQRLKLAQHLKTRSGARYLFLLDEPTTGLHLADVDRLVANLKKLASHGHTVVVIEHHLDVIAAADHVIDLGPEGGDKGGELVFAGPPAALVASGTATGEHLARWLAGIDPLSHGVGEAVKPYRAATGGGTIEVTRARVHNLKQVSVTIPRNGRTVVSGVSGSGKSTLAFDIVFAEGQRRFLDCLSSYARQYITQLSRPDADRIEGIPPTVAIEQRTTRGGSRSNVANVTEIEPFLRLLWARLGEVGTAGMAGRVSVKGLAEHLALVDGKSEIIVTAPIVQSRQGLHKKVFARAAAAGVEVIVNGKLRNPAPNPRLRKRKSHDIEFVVGRVDADNLSPLMQLIEVAAELGEGQIKIFREVGRAGALSPARLFEVESANTKRRGSYDPRYFSARTKLGRCEACRGWGVTADPDTLDDDAKTEWEVCGDCDGTKLGPVGRSVKLGGRSLPEVLTLTAPGVVAFLEELPLGSRGQAIAEGPLKAVRERASFLSEVGLDYLTLDRGVRSLSGGEAQRIRLAAQLGAHLSGVLYVLDEPTIGLHPTDTERLLGTLDELQSRGNGILMVEHDEMTLRTADVLIDMGPGAGVEGGEVMVAGDLATVLADDRSITGECLREGRPLSRKKRRSVTAKTTTFLELGGVEHHNLSRARFKIPRGRLTVVTGVSGSGKSSLVDVVMAAVDLKQGFAKGGGTWTSRKGFDGLDRIVQVDDKPIGKNPRSTPATYVGVWDQIRKLFASHPDAKIRGYKPGRFSFNVKGGRCDACDGNGQKKLEMSFLPDAYVGCGVCGGRRFNRQTLEVRWNGMSIHDVLALPIKVAVERFERVPKIAAKLKLLDDVGLGYLTLGQSSPTLSGGEAQRIKLVSFLSEKRRDDTLLILDEPTIGLHMADVPKLLDVIHRLVDVGNTVIVVEHNADVMREADWVIDMGPGGGVHGGKVLHQGSFARLIGKKASRTGQYLASMSD